MILYVNYSLDSVFKSNIFNNAINCDHERMHTCGNVKFDKILPANLADHPRPLLPTNLSQNPISEPGFSIIIVKL